MIRLLKILLILSLILFNNYYVINSPFRLYFIFPTLLFFLFLLNNKLMLYKYAPLNPSTRQVLIAAFLLLVYIYTVNIFRGDFVEGTKDLIAVSLIPLMLIVFEKTSKKFNPFNIIIYSSVISLIFAILQVFNFKINMNSLFPEFWLIQSDQRIQLDFRISGAMGEVIAFSHFIGILFILLYYLYQLKRRKLYLIILIILVPIIFFTQTRSLIFGLVPSLLLAELILKRMKTSIVLKWGSLILLIIFVASNTIERHLSRVTTVSDGSTIEKLSANIYAIVATAEKNFLFGLPYHRAEETAKEGKQLVGKLRFTNKKHTRISTTHHNQLAWYFRYYGLFGILLLLYLHLQVFKKILSKKDIKIKLILMSIFIFILQFSMLHNNKLISDWFLWLLLAVGDEE